MVLANQCSTLVALRAYRFRFAHQGVVLRTSTVSTVTFLAREIANVCQAAEASET